MIKNLLNADEDPPEGTKVIIEDAVVNFPSPPETSAEEAAQNPSARRNFEIPDDARFFVKSTADAEDSAEFNEFSAAFEGIEDRNIVDPHTLSTDSDPAPANEDADSQAEFEKQQSEIFGTTENAFDGNLVEPAESVREQNSAPSAGTLFQSDYTPPSTAQTIRNSGLAWSAGIVLFGSVIFMMIFGWFADLLFGSSPWGLLGGIILGGLIGIIQLFRISSQIYRK